MRKKTWDYIQMGLRSKAFTQQKKAEEEARKKEEAQAFNKTFTDKTYSVAKKVIENVEKVGNYDYEKLFDRVKHDIEDKIGPDNAKVKVNINIKSDGKKQGDTSSKPKKHETAHASKASKIVIEQLKKDISDSLQTSLKDVSKPRGFKAPSQVSPPKPAEDLQFTKPVKPEPIELKEVVKPVVEGKPVVGLDDEVKPLGDIYEGPSQSNKASELRRRLSKENKEDSDRYHKKKRRDKFAKKMKVQLDDTLIVQQKRSLTRLFKFSLAFKLSFVFILLMIVTLVTLSVGFYFGIDYVVDLKDTGRLEDIALFKDVLLVLLILFNLAAVLLCISVGSKASRGLVRPLDEMTMIVKQINGEAMDRRLNIKGMHDELKELAVTFNEMLERIELAYETQNRFTSDASHELRTPIAVIQGYVNMLDRWGKADGEVLDESIEAIKSEANNMKRLTEKLLLLAKADKGILEMNFEEFSLKDLIEEITKETHMIDSSHEIVNEINAVDLIRGDRPSLKQALRIFVDNSVKYTPDGGRIAINAYHRKKGIYIEISDNGIGISEEDMKQVFNRFYRADPSRTKASGGHGLGLSIAKWIIKEHKGELEIKSELNKGTVVTVFLSSV